MRGVRPPRAEDAWSHFPAVFKVLGLLGPWALWWWPEAGGGGPGDLVFEGMKFQFRKVGERWGPAPRLGAAVATVWGA